MTITDKEEKRLERLTIRVDREFNQWLDRVAAYRGIDKSKLVRFAIEEWTENHKAELTPSLFKWLWEWKERRSRKDIL
jgi:predicted transcriptional regulator